jgi:exopolyphosphatase/pppGpp-phosphohydrolase
MLAGAVVGHAAMKALAVPTVQISPWALREGILLQRLDGLTAADRVHANRLVSASRHQIERSTSPVRRGDASIPRLWSGG